MFNKIGSEQTVIILLLFVAFSLISCAQKKEEVKNNKKNNITSAVCVLDATEGNNVSGIIKFEKTNDGVKIIADVEGLTPGKHGFHIHEFGDCSRLDGKSAGGHFNPEGKNHGSPDATEKHIGDLGNLIATKDGKAHYERIDTIITLNGLHSIIGRAIIVHAGEDDLTSQPTGAAGSRVACGVIGISK